MYTSKDYKNLLGMNGFSDNALNIHFTLYEGYVKNVNSILEKFSKGEVKEGSYEMGELKRRFGWEYNGMKLHEIYFESLIKDGKEIDKESNLAKAIEKDFTNFENFLEKFKSAGLARGIGWILLVKEENTGELFITWVDEHDRGLLANAKIILSMDVFEHAFIPDYATKKAEYIDAFISNINWEICEQRFER
ncbi:Superoxide dismutase [Fe] [bioreactor metagenome]|uniref:superoxide dismutase n=1 Tax=bioreactor metagenome TaxID=1076179 RepID=A0A644T603_9ZZZZ|nr:Fe-Mn family superoxide dismutase [Candidatus Elulimicrobiales bacterium]